ncbi:Murein DD-endopeptidase MepM and murein hydrolase activator NlpD, contain LysM domain [Thermus arciformis]|uniref:Murein DD-endopeptidase MepM and murein hydrolase activator NlpD, contain LysM domain n=1 Tax=Thermus arciformis TaxID=482827 RepID=A0A1G7DQS8_9DEIN|nr:M23 family metallopeptidase [Thermus arciformis]SDE53894.1 Murein DD-endopeptidase MepM and murein hydrolase activator NlpD, contain LysM domain [Thermus arciformis]
MCFLAAALAWAQASPLILSPIPLPEATVEVGRAPKKGWVLYRVKPGDTLAGLAARYGVDPRHIQWSSGLKDDRLQVGQELRIPLVAAEEREPRVPPGVEAYRVRPGDTLASLAQRFGLSPLDLVSANPSLESLDRLVAGSVIYIPKGAKGLLVSLPEGETLVSLAQRFGLSPLRVAQANGVKDPTALRPGDLVLLPGVQAKTTYERLLAKQEEERRARLEAERRRQEELRRLAEERRRQEALRQAQVQRRQAQASRPQVRRVSYQEGGMRWPLSGFRITTYFGQRGAFQRYHTGIDLAAPYGTPIVAAKAGQVEVAGWSSWGYGFHVVLDHGGGVETLYAHMSRIAVRPGAWVEAGQVIGYVGSTGWSTGPHLHFEVRVGGVARNPLAYLP